MKSIVKRFTIVTHHETELIDITDRVIKLYDSQKK